MQVLSINDPCGIPLLALADVGITPEAYTATAYKSRVPGNDIGELQEKFIRENFPQIILENRIRYPPDLFIGTVPKPSSSTAQIGIMPFAIQYTIDMLNAIARTKPKYFLVICPTRISKQHSNIIQRMLPRKTYRTVLSASALTPIHDRRTYYSNFKIDHIGDINKMVLQDIIESGYVDRDISLSLTTTYHRGISLDRYLKYRQRQIVYEQDPMTTDEVVEKMKYNSNPLNYQNGQRIRKLNPREIQKLYELPENFFANVTSFNAYKLTSTIVHRGILRHIFSCLPSKKII